MADLRHYPWYGRIRSPSAGPPATRVLVRPRPQTKAPASDYTGATRPLERDAEAHTTPQLKWAVREGTDMNDPSVAVSSEDTSQVPDQHQSRGRRRKAAGAIAVCSDYLRRARPPYREGYVTVNGWWPR
jgi:hypothetical protein